MMPDVVVLGAGIVGICVARQLARAGAGVVVVDPAAPGTQASWVAAGMLAPQAEADEPGDFFSLLLRARERFPALVAELFEETGVDLGYRTEGLLVLAFGEEEDRELEARRVWQSVAGLQIERLTALEILRLEPRLSERLTSGLRVPDHQIDNRLLLRALYTSAATAGVKFRGGWSANSVHPAHGSVRIDGEGGDHIEAASVVIAAGSWTGLIGGLPSPIPVEPVHGELLAIDMGPGPVRHTIVSTGGYVVPRSDGRLIVGTTVARDGFRERVSAAGFRHLARTASQIVPGLAHRPILAHWAGLRPGTPDGLPILGRDPSMDGVFYAAGHYRNGILLGPLTGEIVAGLIMGRPVAIDIRPYSVERFRGSGIADPS